MTEYHRAARAGDVALLRAFVEAGTALDVRSKMGATALMEAAGAGKEEAVGWLLAKGADFNLTDTAGKGLLVAAAQGGSVKVMEALVAAGAKAAPEDRLLEIAAAEGNLEMVSWLAPRYPESLNGALEVASGAGEVATVTELLKAGASLFNGKALMRAAKEGQGDVVSVLLAAGANRFAADAQGLIALDHAATVNNQEVLRQLRARPSLAELEPQGHESTRIREFVGRADVGLDLVLKLRLKAVREVTLPFQLRAGTTAGVVFQKAGGEQREIPVALGEEVGDGWRLARVRISPVPWAPIGALLLHDKTQSMRLALPDLPIRAGEVVALVTIEGRGGSFELQLGDEVQLDGSPWVTAQIGLSEVTLKRGDTEVAFVRAHDVDRQ
ncbi:MAG: ankyrin repeat domain-containing protein [Verrucomicrobiaceae bacterium]|nr:ankyrin repeat domain-containing protein [Verrucomicrobiaceae bacterium]